MAQLDPSRRAVSLKLVYWGPERSGKTTNVQHLHGRYPEARRGRLVKLDTDVEETHFFDYFPVELGEIDGWSVRLDVVSAPGRPELTTTRRDILEYADGVVFVADSAPGRRQDNLDALAELRAVLASVGRRAALAFQWNQRDRDRCLPIEELEHQLNAEGAPSHAATAARGEGVWETHRLVVTTLLGQLRAALPDAVAALDDGAPDETHEVPLFQAPSGPRPRRGRRVVGPGADTIAQAQPEPVTAAPARDVMDDDDPHRRRARELAAVPGVIATCVVGGEGAVLASVGPIDAPSMATATATADAEVRAAMAAVGFAAPTRWSIDFETLGWNVLREGDALALVSAPTETTPGGSLLRVFGPEPTS